MNLKEAFRYQNKLQSFLDEAQSILDRDSNVTRVENTYLRHKVSPLWSLVKQTQYLVRKKRDFLRK